MRRGVRFLPLVLISLLLAGCNEEAALTDPEDLVLNEILPGEITLDIPDALSFNTTLAGGRVRQEGIIEGDDIYNNLRAFIWVGESSKEILNDLFELMVIANIDSAVAFSIISDEDGRQKDFELKQRTSLDSRNFRFQMNVNDEDGSRAAQLFWNTNPIEIVAFLKPYDINRTEEESLADLFYKIDYTQDDSDYEESMLVSISNIPESTGLNNLQMFVGKNGDIIEVFGNSNHPNITLINPSFTGGRNYAFVARGDAVLDLGVAAVALPPSAVDTNEGLIDDFSVFSVFEDELMTVGITDQEVIDLVLANASAPAYFVGEDGFISSGTTIPDNPAFSNSFIDLSGLTPFVPRDIRDLDLIFSEE